MCICVCVCGGPLLPTSASVINLHISLTYSYFTTYLWVTKVHLLLHWSTHFCFMSFFCVGFGSLCSSNSLRWLIKSMRISLFRQWCLCKQLYFVELLMYTQQETQSWSWFVFCLSIGYPKKTCDYKICQLWSLATECSPETTERHPSYPAIEEVQAAGRKEKGPETGQSPQASYHTSQQTPSLIASHRRLRQPQVKTG